MKKNVFYIVLFSILLFVSWGLPNTKPESDSKDIYDTLTNRIPHKASLLQELPEGYAFITNYSFAKQKKIKSICTDSIGKMVFADNTGLSFFDGKNEQFLKIKEAPNDIVRSKYLNRIYIACRNGYGYVETKKNGKFAYLSLSERFDETGLFNHVEQFGDNILFCGEHKITEYNPQKDTVSNFYNDTSRPHTGYIILNDALFINFPGRGLHKIRDKKFSALITDSLFAESKIIFSVPYGESVIIGLSNNKLYLFDGNAYSPYANDAEEYIEESIINNAKNINSEQFIVTTLNGGAVLLNKKSGKIVNTFNYRTGLPDDEIYAAGTDLAGSIWLSQEYGVSRIALDIPVKNFDRYPGLQGRINAVEFHDSTLYIATGEGLYRLLKIKNYEEVEVAEKKRVKYLSKVKVPQKKKYNAVETSAEVVEEEKDEIEEDKEERWNFIKRWKNRKKKRKKEEKEKEKKTEKEKDKIFSGNSRNEQTKKNTSSAKSYKTRYKTKYKTVTNYKKIYELQSIKYIYKKIDNIDSKCKKITKFNSGLLISSNAGLYYIKNNKTSLVIPNAYIYNLSCRAKSNIFYVSTSEGLYKINYKNSKFIKKLISKNIPENTLFKSLFTVNDTLLWASSTNTAFLFSIHGNKVVSSETFNLENDFNEEIIITKKDSRILFLTNTSACFYNEEQNILQKDSNLNNILSEQGQVYMLSDTLFIINQGHRILYSNIPNDSLSHIKYLSIFSQIKNITIDSEKDIWLVTGANEIYKIEKEKNKQAQKFECFLTGIKDFKGNFLPIEEKLKLNSNYKRITIQLSAPAYLQKDFVRYYYGIDVKNSDEYISTQDAYFHINQLSPGKHILSMYAENALGAKSEVIYITLQVTPPFWEATWFIVAVFLVFIILVALAISLFYRKKQKKIKKYNEELEKKVKERTEEIENQNKLIQKQNIEIYNQYQKIERQNKDTNESIKYARIIQQAALSEPDIYSKYIDGLFILFKPRDIVSGDFYWISESKNRLLIAAVDCTGHGVPGGFLSMLGISFLNEIVKEKSKENKKILAADILNELREKIITTLSSSRNEESRDGMDMSLAVIDKENMILNFAGAHNPAYIIRNEQIAKIKADHMPVGYNKALNHIPFNNKYVKLKKGDNVYLFSDGYPDQFGGKFEKKFNAGRFRELLIFIHKLPPEEQKITAERILKKWMGDNDQIDDILLIGIKI